jgi:branched-chain amino acid aminotransferase
MVPGRLGKIALGDASLGRTHSAGGQVMAAVFFYDGEWLDENPRLTGPMDHAFWMSSVVFDGARAFGGLAPDLPPHCERLVASARSMLLGPKLAADEIAGLCTEAVRKFPKEAELYIRPMFYAREGFLTPDADSTEFVLAVYEQAMPGFKGFSVCRSSYRRPARNMAPTDAKASCLYPNTARVLREANAKGFDNAVVLDNNGNVAEFATANLWIAKDRVAMTPAVNGTFLNGVTRQRMIELLGEAGIEVQERTIGFEEVMDADEIFNTGNYGKVMPVTRIEDRDLQPGPIFSKAKDLYLEYANTASVF